MTMLKNHWFLYVFLKGQEGPEESKRTNEKAVRTFFDVEKVIFQFRMLRIDCENCASCLGGEHIFETIVKKIGRKMKNAP